MSAPKFCRDCAHSFSTHDVQAGQSRTRCNQSQVASTADGSLAGVMRAPGAACGPDAQLYEAKNG